ncbi:MAG: negative regulator of tic competence, sporulation and motility [Clostridia bacterium]|nr:negative regulator of tic competence, sporulation and motility [Clostridia bacterium]
MKVEKINENKVRITLSIDELAQRDISLNDLEKDTVKAKKLFLELIEESNLESSFIFEHAQLFVEAATDSNDFFTVTITKIDDFPDLTKYNLLDEGFSKKNEKKSSTKLMSPINSNIFSFESLDNILDMCDILKGTKSFLGKNSLYKLDSKYFLIFSKYSIKNTKFLKTYSIINEFCLNNYESELYEISLKEKSQLIISNKALQSLAKL